MKYWKKLTRASKIVFVLWTIDAAYMVFSGESNIGLPKSIMVWLFGYLIFVGLTQLLTTMMEIERRKKESTDANIDSIDLENFARECNYYVVRKERRERIDNPAPTYLPEEEFKKEAEISETEPELHGQLDIYEADKMLKRTKELSEIANKTTNREEFHNSINEIKNILTELSKHEGRLPFIGSPSYDLSNLVEIEQEQIELLEKRIEEKNRNDKESFCLSKLKRAKELENILNSTIDEKDFALSLNELTNIWYSLTSYENEIEFQNLPSNELKKLKENREKYFDLFYQRRRESKSIEKTDGMYGQEFEEFCSKLLENNGFSNIELTKGSGDHGIDILAEKDEITYAIQCKCYSSSIGNSAVQQAHTGKSLYRKDIAVVMANQYFTPQAKEEATALRVKLWDRDKLNEMIENQD